MSAWLDVCRFVPAAGGTSDWAYSSTVQGYNSPTLAGAVNGRIYSYRAESSDLSQWEVGFGAYSSGTNTFVRTTVLYNSSGTGTGAGQSGAGTKINFSTVPQVAIVALKEDLISIEEANAFTATQKAQARLNLSTAAFSVHKNGTDQTGVASGTDTLVTFGSAMLNVGNFFDTSTGKYTPPAGRVFLSAQFYGTGTIPAGNPYDIAIWKNGALLKEMFIYSALANNGAANISLVDDANGTDFYQVFVRFANVTGTATVNGATKWTFFSGGLI